MNIGDIKAQAAWELKIERFEAAVENEKDKLRRHRPFWKKVFPYVITVTKDKGE